MDKKVKKVTIIDSYTRDVIMKPTLQTIYYNDRPVKHFPKGRHRSAWSYYHDEEIGKDEKGRSYEVHHIDGNHSNNLPWNLKLVTIEEHYAIHYEQKDWGACLLMAERMELDLAEVSRVSKLSNEQRVKDGTHHLLSENRKDGVRYGRPITSEAATRLNAERVKDGTHNWLKDENGNSLSSERVKKRTHNFLKENRKPGVQYGVTSEQAKEITKKAIEAGTHNSVRDNPQKQKWKCLVTGKVTNKRTFTVMAKQEGLDKWPHQLERIK